VVALCALAAPASAGTIVVRQDTLPNGPGVFSYTAGGGLSPTSFQLRDDGHAGNQQIYNNVPAGSGYSVSQDTPPPSGYDPPNASCSDGSSPSNIDVGASETVTCTFYNRLSTAGTITIVKDAQPNDPQNFSFSLGGPTPPGSVSFSLRDDGSGTGNSTQFYVNPGSGYHISEFTPATWALQSSTCSDGSSFSSITVDPNEDVVCTFVNIRAAQIRIIVDAQPNDPQDFSFTTGGGLSPSSFSLDDDASTTTLSNEQDFNSVVPGSGYSVAENVPANWQSSAICDDGSPVTNIDVSEGEIVTCTFTNTATDTGTITVHKDSHPTSTDSFGFQNNTPAGFFTLADDGPGGLPQERTITARAGTYFVNEQVTPTWDLVSAKCSDGSAPGSISLSAGENVVCTFVNQQRGTIKIVKDAQPDGPQDFTFTPSGFGSTFILDDDTDNVRPSSQTFTNLLPGQYSVSEAAVAGWTNTSATCSNGSPVTNISVAPGEFVTCTFVNEQYRTLIVRQDTVPDDPQDFTFNAAGGGLPPSFQLDDDGNDSNGLSSSATFSGLGPGPYSLSQVAVPGYDLSDASCSNGQPVTSVTVALGETVTCTFKNYTPNAGSITVVKDAQPDGVTPFHFSTSGGTEPSTFSLDDDGNENNARRSSQTVVAPAPGSGYSVTEVVPPGWEQTSATCSDGSPVTNISVSAGEDITCTFVNTQQVVYPGYPRPKAATPFYAPFVPAHRPCVSPNRVHGGSLNYGSCSPPMQTTTTASVGSPDSNGAAANSSSSLRMAVTGSGATTDVALVVSSTDVRCLSFTQTTFPCGAANAAAGRDYVGELRVRGTIRDTDKLNGSGAGGPSGTVTDIDWGPTVPCVPSAGTTIGATCSLTTTFNTLIPGSVVAGARSIWEHSQISIYDGGPDGDGDTLGDNQPFLRQGVFIP
jgi:hypothetical protein